MKFKMNNEEWEIIETNQEKMCEEYNEEFKNDGNFYNGITCPIKKKILLYEDLDSQQKKKTLYHELMHCKSFDEPVIQYVGIAYDEPKRYERLNHETHIAPLYDLKITEKEAMEICEKYDLVSPIYKTSFRGGCWFCPKQRLSQLKWLYKEHNDLWNILKDMEKDSFNTFKPNVTLKDLEERFENNE